MTMGYWEFLDYVDEHGVNQIDAWLDGLRPGIRDEVRDKLDTKLKYAMQMQRLGAPNFKPRRGKGTGLWEIVFEWRRVAYRPLVCFGPESGQVTILAGAREHNDQLRPPNIERTALARKYQLDEPGRVKRHVLNRRSGESAGETTGGSGG